jgi:hypothetical protein
MIRITVAGLLAAAWLTAQTGTAPEKPTDPGVLHPMPVPKSTPQPVPPGTQPDPKTQNRARTEKSRKSQTRDKKSQTPNTGARGENQSPKAKTEAKP